MYQEISLPGRSYRRHWLSRLTILLRLIIVLSVPLLGACGAFHNVYHDYGVAPLCKLDKPIDKPVDKPVAKPMCGDVVDIDTSCVVDATVSLKNEEKRQECILKRNNVVGTLLIRSDNLCQEHMKSIYGNEATYNIIFGTLTSALSGLSSIFSDTVTKTALSTSALFTNAERSLINESVYKNAVISAIVTKISEDREVKKKAIIDKMMDTNLSYEKYPIHLAIFDVTQYHYDCSFMYGLRKALAEGTQNTTAQKILELKRNLNELELQMKTRAAEVGIGTKGLSDDAVSKDFILAQLKERHSAIQKELMSLETRTPQSMRTPGAPTDVTATGGNTQATVSFKAPASDGGSAITSYTVTSNPKEGVDSDAGKPTTKHQITGLTNGKAYTFTVTATNAFGTGPASLPSNEVTPAPDGPVRGSKQNRNRSLKGKEGG